VNGTTRRHARPHLIGIAVVLLVAAVVVAIRLYTGPTAHLIPGAMAPRIHPPLHTKDGQIYDSGGHPIRMLGIQIHGMASGTGAVGPCPGYATPTARTFHDVLTWGFNAVRLAISWSNLEPHPPMVASDGTLIHQYDPVYVAAIDRAVDGFTREGIAVVVQMAQSKWTPAFRDIPTELGVRCAGYGMPAWLYPNAAALTIPEAKLAFFQDQGGVQEQYAAACRFVAGRYTGDAYVVGFDMMNEPYVGGGLTPDQFDLNGLYQRVGSAIRSVNPAILLVFQDTQDLGTGQFALRSPPPFPNIVYSYHLYVPNWVSEGLQRTNDYERRADQWHVPLWIGEFAAFGYARGGDYPWDWRTQLELMMKYGDQHHISWSLDAKGPSSVGDPAAGNPPLDLVAAIQTDFPVHRGRRRQ